MEFPKDPEHYLLIAKVYGLKESTVRNLAENGFECEEFVQLDYNTQSVMFRKNFDRKDLLNNAST